MAEQPNLDYIKEISGGNEDFEKKFLTIIQTEFPKEKSDYLETLERLTSLLTPDGLLIQWDWLKAENEAGAGFSAEQIRSAFHQAGLKEKYLSVAFSMEMGGDKMDVLMAVGQSG